jgi:YbbR domain-containing protein
MTLRDIFIKDVGWKLFSLALATVIWFTVRPVSREPAKPGNPLAAAVPRTFTNLPVVVMSSAADVRAFKVMPDTVTVTVSGKREIVDALAERDIRVTVDLTEIESARGLQARVAVAVPPGVTFIAARPPEVDVVVPPKSDSEK